MTRLTSIQLVLITAPTLGLAACQGGPVKLEQPFFDNKSCTTPGMYYGEAYCPPAVVAEYAKAPIYCYKTLAQTECFSEPREPVVGVLGKQSSPIPVTDPPYWPPRTDIVFASPQGPMLVGVNQITSGKQSMVPPSGDPRVTPVPPPGAVVAQPLPPLTAPATVPAMVPATAPGTAPATVPAMAPSAPPTPLAPMPPPVTVPGASNLPDLQPGQNYANGG